MGVSALFPTGYILQHPSGPEAAYLSGLFLIFVVFLLFAGIINVGSSSRAVASLLIKGLIILFVIELGLAVDQVAHAVAHGYGWLGWRKLVCK